MSFKAKLKNLSAIAALQSDLLHIVAAKDARIATLADLKGKRVSVGLVRSDTELAARALLAAVGIKHKDFGTAEYLSIADAAELLKRARARRLLPYRAAGGPCIARACRKHRDRFDRDTAGDR